MRRRDFVKSVALVPLVGCLPAKQGKTVKPKKDGYSAWAENKSEPEKHANPPYSWEWPGIITVYTCRNYGGECTITQEWEAFYTSKQERNARCLLNFPWDRGRIAEELYNQFPSGDRYSVGDEIPSVHAFGLELKLSSICYGG